MSTHLALRSGRAIEGVAIGALQHDASPGHRVRHQRSDVDRRAGFLGRRVRGRAFRHADRPAGLRARPPGRGSASVACLCVCECGCVQVASAMHVRLTDRPGAGGPRAAATARAPADLVRLQP